MSIKKILNSILKSTSILITFGIMYAVFGFSYGALRVISRTLIVFIGTYFMAFTIFNNVFGTFQFGELKSKPITYTTALAVFFTDIIAYVSILIMSTNPNNPQANQRFVFQHFHLLIIAFLLQLVFIYLVSYLGNYIYFRYFKPKNTVLVVSTEDYSKYETYLRKYIKQYNLISIVDVDSKNLAKEIMKADLVVLTDLSLEKRKVITDYLYLNNIDFIYTATVTDMILLNGHTTIYDDIPVVEVNTGKMTFEERVIKRLMDIIISLIAIVATLPIWLIIVISIKIDDGGPVFYTQKRKTLKGRVFNVIKFRTMKTNSKNFSALEEDDRITRVGRILRKIRLDELPQFLNILFGSMSVVGPRPEMVENIKHYEIKLPEFKYRLKMKAGLTGLAQIEGKYNTNPKEKLIMDLSYIENYSIWLDVKLIFRTFIVFFKKDSVDGF